MHLSAHSFAEAVDVIVIDDPPVVCLFTLILKCPRESPGHSLPLFGVFSGAVVIVDVTVLVSDEVAVDETVVDGVTTQVLHSPGHVR